MNYKKLFQSSYKDNLIILRTDGVSSIMFINTTVNEGDVTFNDKCHSFKVKYEDMCCREIQVGGVLIKVVYKNDTPDYLFMMVEKKSDVRVFLKYKEILLALETGELSEVA